MITMCKMYEFPKQLELPKEEAELLALIGEGYIKAMFTSAARLVEDPADIEKMKEVTKLVEHAFAQGIFKGISDLEKQS